MIENCDIIVYRTLVACLHVWLDTYPEDFRQSPHHPALQQLLAFTQLHLPGSELHSKVRDL
jgi:ral guanine nucleotide dissociation stimulator-like 1